MSNEDIATEGNHSRCLSVVAIGPANRAYAACALCLEYAENDADCAKAFARAVLETRPFDAADATEALAHLDRCVATLHDDECDLLARYLRSAEGRER